CQKGEKIMWNKLWKSYTLASSRLPFLPSPLSGEGSWVRGGRRPRKSYRPALERLEDRLAPAALPPTGLVSWYRAEDNANDFADGNNGTLQGGATFAAGEVGQAFNLNGTSNFVQVPHNANLNPGSGSFTVDAWIFQT